MGGSGGKVPSAPKQAPAVQETPVQETGQTEAERKAREDARRKAAAAAGQQSTILTGGLGTNTGTAGTGSILGSGG